MLQWQSIGGSLACCVLLCLTHAHTSQQLVSGQMATMMQCTHSCPFSLVCGESFTGPIMCESIYILLADGLTERIEKRTAFSQIDRLGRWIRPR